MSWSQPRAISRVGEDHRCFGEGDLSHQSHYSSFQDVPEAPSRRPEEEDAERILCMNAFMRASGMEVEESGASHTALTLRTSGRTAIRYTQQAQKKHSNI